MAGESVDLGYVVLELPPGYIHRAYRGIDSEVGDITIKDKLYTIHYDSEGWGQSRIPTNLSGFNQSMLEYMVYYEAVQGSDPRSCIYAQVYPNDPKQVVFTLSIFDPGVSFHMDLPAGTSLQDAASVLRALKITKRKAP